MKQHLPAPLLTCTGDCTVQNIRTNIIILSSNVRPKSLSATAFIKHMECMYLQRCAKLACINKYTHKSIYLLATIISMNCHTRTHMQTCLFWDMEPWIQMVLHGLSRIYFNSVSRSTWIFIVWKNLPVISPLFYIKKAKINRKPKPVLCVCIIIDIYCSA